LILADAYSQGFVTSSLTGVSGNDYSPPSLYLASEERSSRANAVAPIAICNSYLEWLAIALTPGLGPTKARKLVEHFGSAEAVFHASLTELEGTGIQAVSAAVDCYGKSAELAREEIARVAPRE